MAATVISVVSPCMVTPSLKIEKPPEKNQVAVVVSSRQFDIGIKVI